jgi:protein-disulfide isomerase
MTANPLESPVPQRRAERAPTPAPAPAPPTIHTLRLPANAPSRGPAQARVVIEAFTDFQCPFCSRVLPTIEQVLQHYPNDVRVVFRNYPLPFHSNAMLAAEAAREVFVQQGAAGFWRYHDVLFQNQRALERADLERYAQQQRVDMRRFRRALDLHSNQPAVREEMAGADATGVSIGTPAFFVNGRLVLGAQPLQEFVRAVDEALQTP